MLKIQLWEFDEQLDQCRALQLQLTIPGIWIYEDDFTDTNDDINIGFYIIS
jgi:hypothetical protein